MITLITGVPGTGKSALAMQLLLRVVYGSDSIGVRLLRWLQALGHRIVGDLVPAPVEREPKRKVFVLGVPELKIPHEAWTVDEAARWHDLAPEGAAILVDEVQKLWRPRGAGSRVPDEIKALEEHRHTGNDFFLITQKPRLLDSNVRDLVGRHVHIRDCGILGRWLYEWPECSESLAWKSAPIKRRYRLPREVFSLYKSASLHVKPIRGVPMALFLAVGAVVGALFLGWRAVDSVRSKMAGASPASAGKPGEGAKVAGSASAPRAIPMPAAPALLRVGAPVKDREPYDGFGVHLVGSYSQGGATVWAFTLSMDGKPLAPAQLPELLKAGYAWRPLGPCVGVLIFGERERVVRCDAPNLLPVGRPALGASAPAV